MSTTVKKLSYCDVTIPLSTPELGDWLDSVHPPQDFYALDFWNYDHPNVGNLPTPNFPTVPHFKIGSLFWPTGASEVATFVFVTTTARLNQIKAFQGTTNSANDLVMFDGRVGKTVTASMFSLPELPVVQLGPDAWLVRLVDQRFYWYWNRIPHLECDGETTTWGGLYTQLFDALGITPTIATISADYGLPSRKWDLRYPPTPVVLDAVAAQIGQRIVCGLDGSVSTVNWEDARTASSDYFENGPAVLSGGLVPEASIARYVPESVVVLFSDETASSTVQTPKSVTVPLSSLTITAYGSATGVTGRYQTLNGDLVYSGTNLPQITSCASAMARAWYGWRLPDADVVYPGIEPWVPTGWEDSIEWIIQKRGDQPFASTTVRRGPWTDFQGGTWEQPEDECTGHEWVAGLTADDCLTLDFTETLGRCDCTPAPTSGTVLTGNGSTWDTDQSSLPVSVTICDVDYNVSFEKGACNGPCLTLTQAGCCTEGASDSVMGTISVSGGNDYFGLLYRRSGGWENSFFQVTQVFSKTTSGDGVYVPTDSGIYLVYLWGPGADNIDGAGGAVSGGSGGGAFAFGQVTLTSGNTYHIHVGNGIAPGDDTTFETTQVLAKAGSPSSTTTGGAGGSAGSSTGSVKYSGGAGANASGSNGGGGGGGAGFAGAGTNASGMTGGAFGGGTGGASGFAGTNGTSPSGGAGGQGFGSLGATSGGVGKALIYEYLPSFTPPYDNPGRPSIFARLYCVGGDWYCYTRLPDGTEVTVGPLSESADGTLTGTSGTTTVSIASPCPGSSPSPVGPFVGTRGCGGCNYSNFSFGDVGLCTETPAEGGPCKNLLKATVSWTCCPIAGWQGAGWYCITATSVVGDTPAPAELLDSDKCDSSITIESGPYATESEAQAACPVTTPTYDLVCGIYSNLPNWVQVVISSQCPEFLVDHPGGSLTVFAGPSTAGGSALWQLPPNIGRDIGDPGGWYIGGYISCQTDPGTTTCNGPFTFKGGFQGCGSSVGFECNLFPNQTGSGTASPVAAVIELYPVPGPTGLFTLTITDYGPGP